MHPAFLSKVVEQLVSRSARARKLVLGDLPDLGDVATSDRIVNFPVTRKLISFLTVLTPSLTVALTGETAIATRRSANQSQRQDEIDICQGVIDSLALLLTSTHSEDHGGLCCS